MRRRADPGIEPFFDRGRDEPFFVKNLENIQGDERDVIFLSVTYATRHGRPAALQVRPNQRRERLASAERADDARAASGCASSRRCTATTSTRPQRSHGPRLLREFLLYAEHGRLESALADDSATRSRPSSARCSRSSPGAASRRSRRSASPATASISGSGRRGAGPLRLRHRVRRRGLSPAESARDRDRLRQQVLEARGWTILRVWSTDWFKDRAGQIDRLLKAIEAARAHGRAQKAADTEAQVPTSDQADAGRRIRRLTGRAILVSGNPLGHPGPSGPLAEYRRPATQPYEVTPGEGRFAGTDILQADESRLSEAIQTVIDFEAPIHVAELMTRVAGMWGNKAGSRIQARIHSVASRLASEGAHRRRSDFVWGPSDECKARSRAQMKIPADRVSPEEFEQAVLSVLASGHRLPRAVLTAEVRSVLGYSRTGAIIEDAVSDAISRLLASGRLGEGSTGLAVRSGRT